MNIINITNNSHHQYHHGNTGRQRCKTLCYGAAVEEYRAFTGWQKKGSARAGVAGECCGDGSEWASLRSAYRGEVV